MKKKLWLVVLVLGCMSPGALSETGGGLGDLPRDLQMEEQLLVLSAKVKKVAEIQDLIVQQQQLLLQHLNALESQVRLLQAQGTNTVPADDLARCREKLAEVERQVHTLKDINLQNVCAFLHDWFPPTSAPPEAQGGLSFGKLEMYKVQAGDTLLRILARVNDLREQHQVPRITQGQVEKANPGLAPDRIRAGQMILLPALDSAQPGRSGG